jgi:hypothetical protein
MKSKQELIDYVAHQLNITLENNKNDILNDRRKILHTTITKANKNAVLSLLNKKGIRYENHINNYYFIYI